MYKTLLDTRGHSWTLRHSCGHSWTFGHLDTPGQLDTLSAASALTLARHPGILGCSTLASHVSLDGDRGAGVSPGTLIYAIPLGA